MGASSSLTEAKKVNGRQSSARVGPEVIAESVLMSLTLEALDALLDFNEGRVHATASSTDPHDIAEHGNAHANVQLVRARIIDLMTGGELM